MKTNPTMQAEAVLPTRPVSENGKINILTRLAYGGGDVACNVVYGMIATLLTLFYTDVYKRQILSPMSPICRSSVSISLAPPSMTG